MRVAFYLITKRAHLTFYMPCLITLHCGQRYHTLFVKAANFDAIVCNTDMGEKIRIHFYREFNEL